MTIDSLRTLLYPIGLIATFLFSLRFFIQWIGSERKKESHVTPLFWLISLFGNGVMALHGVLQGQFPLAVLQGSNAAIAWRNRQLMQPHPLPLKCVFLKMGLFPFVVIALFALQGYFLHSFDWMRPPVLPWNHSQAERAGLLWHLFGCAGMVLFSSRFWIQWWEAEREGVSRLGKSFWILSVLGSLLALTYFIRLGDVVNIAGYSVGIFPYVRNLFLSKKKGKPLERGRLFLFAGEQSGDELGQEVVRHLKAKHFSLYGVGGKKMREAGMEILLPMEAFQVMGFSAVLKAARRLFSHFRSVRNEILHTLPEAVILIDYPDFNMLLSASLRKRGYRGKIIHYVSPSVWAWRKRRIRSLAKHLDLLLTILPFEKKLYAHTSLQVEYVGHPLVKKIATHVYSPKWKQECGLPEDLPLIALFPGSRRHEILHNLPLQLASASMSTLAIAISCARPELENDILKILKKSGLKGYLVPHVYTYELMAATTSAYATSGTVTLELALHKTPTVVTYRLSFVNYILGRYLFRIRLPFYTLPNIILGEEVFPECIHRTLSPLSVASRLQQLMERGKVQAQCEEISKCLQSPEITPLSQIFLHQLLK